MDAVITIPFPDAVEMHGEITAPLSEASAGSVERVLDFAIFSGVLGAQDLLDAQTLFRRNVDRFLTIWASKERLGVNPSQAFLEHVAAVRALKIDGYVVDRVDCHGWPILSLRADTATIAGGGEQGNLPASGDPPPLPKAA